MIRNFLERDDLHYYIDRDGDYAVHVGDLMINLIATGRHDDVYSIMCSNSKEYEGDQLAYAIGCCNEWNADKRWPKAYVRRKTEQLGGRIILEQSLDLETGIHQELLNDFTRIILICCVQFWEWASTEKGL